MNSYDRRKIIRFNMPCFAVPAFPWQRWILVPFLLLLGPWNWDQAYSVSLKVTDLRCEYQRNPLGIDREQPSFSWQVVSEERGQTLSAYQILVSDSASLLIENKGTLWDSGKVNGAVPLLVSYKGKAMPSLTTCYWKVRVWDKDNLPSPWSEPAQWTFGILKASDWKAQWIAMAATAASETAGNKPAESSGVTAARIFRKSFFMKKAIRRALLMVSGLGFHEVHLNGEKVGDNVLEPGWTNYRKRCLYSTYEVTGMLQKGENALAVLLGHGMYHIVGGRYTKFKGSFGEPKLYLQLHIEHEDGSLTILTSDRSWKTALSPITFQCIFGGEDYDAREEIAKWDLPAGDDSRWPQAEEVEGPGGELSAQDAPPIRVMEELKTVRISQPRPGIYIYDFGQNFSGWPRLAVRGPRNTTVKMIPGELLDAGGLVSQAGSGKPVWFSYTLKGKGTETWHPRFSYYGFRYLQVEGAAPASEKPADAKKARILELRGQFIHSSAERTGSFASSSTLVNRIHDLILGAIRSNLQSVLTDCPHREKLGWLEVSHLLGRSLMYNFDLARFYGKIQNDMRDSQTEEGLVPDIAPEFTVFRAGFRDSPEWGSAYILNPWQVWEMYGDRRLLAEHYSDMKRYVGYLAGKATNHIVSHGLGDWYDIGPQPPGKSQLTSDGLTATAIYYQDLITLQKTAALLDKSSESQQFSEAAAGVGRAFQQRFLQKEGRYFDRNSQTANAMPLVLGLVEAGDRQGVLANLVQEIRRGNHRITAGDVGFVYLVRALSESRSGELLYRMVTQQEGPGYAYQLAHGATTLTEAWDSNPASSQNHCMLGHVEEWFYGGLGGIQPDPAGPGFRRFFLRPQPVGDLSWVKTQYDSVRGPIRSEWQRDAQQIRFSFLVPVDSTALVAVPGTDPARITEGGRPAVQSPGVRFLGREGGDLLFEVGSGQYQFVSQP